MKGTFMQLMIYLCTKCCHLDCQPWHGSCLSHIHKSCLRFALTHKALTSTSLSFLLCFSLFCIVTFPLILFHPFVQLLRLFTHFIISTQSVYLSIQQLMISTLNTYLSISSLSEGAHITCFQPIIFLLYSYGSIGNKSTVNEHGFPYGFTLV